MDAQQSIPATLIPGDGIGPEITRSCCRNSRRARRAFEWDEQIGGMAGIEAGGDPLPQATLDSIQRTKLALKGPLTTPVGGGFRSVNVRLREEFGLYANLRPARTMVPGRALSRTSTSCSCARTSKASTSPSSTYIAIGDDPHAVAISSGVNTRPGASGSSGSPSTTRCKTAARRSRSSTRPTSSRP